MPIFIFIFIPPIGPESKEYEKRVTHNSLFRKGFERVKSEAVLLWFNTGRNVMIDITGGKNKTFVPVILTKWQHSHLQVEDPCAAACREQSLRLVGLLDCMPYLDLLRREQDGKRKNM